MKTPIRRLARGASVLCLLLAAAPAAHAAEPDPAQLLAAMQKAMVPDEPRLARVRVTVYKEQAELADRTWEALVARRRFADGPRTAVTLMAPPVTRGSAVLTAPRGDDGDIGLWLFSPSDRRARALAPLDADRNFLVTDFNYDDLALTTRDFVEPQLHGEEMLDGRPTWKVEVKPADRWYYSRIVTWIGQDTLLPVRREYYDRAYRLWKVAEMRDAVIDGIPTLLEITLHDVQTDSRSIWDVRAVSYGADDLDREALSADRLGELDQ
ncbi:MAG: outer membrane lipoprotein-sorting protein, partial [Gammaproteobacteria bacterium]